MVRPDFGMRRINLRIMGLGVAAAMLAANPGFAQQAGGGDNPGQPQAEAETPRIPAAVLSGLLVGTPESMLALRQYLAAFSTSPDEMSRRALDVVAQLRNSGLVRDPALLIAAAERISQSVKETMNSAKVFQVRVDRNFTPPPGMIALDFAPADAKVREGFQRVLPTDEMLQGEGMQSIRRPGDDTDLLSDGIVGIQKMQLNLPDGEYRVTLLTESLGDAATSLSPFGQKIRANGQDIDILQASPDAWLQQAVLSNNGFGGLQNAGSRQGGGIVVTVRVTGGKLDLGFDTGNSGALRTYLTGMLVEPVAQATTFHIPEDVARAARTPVDAQTRYESQLASSLSSLLEEISPQAGGPQQPQDDLLQPVQTVQQASPS